MFGREEDVEINFKAPVVPDAMAGQEVDAATLVKITPPLKAIVIWQSSSSATLVPQGPVPPGRSYRLALRRDLKDTSGNPVVPGPDVTVAGPPFEVEKHTPRWFSMNEKDARVPKILLFCSDEVSAQAVSAAAYFSDKAGRKIKVAATPVLVGDLGKYPSAFGRWNNRHGVKGEGEEGTTPPLPPAESPALSVVRVSPVSPLPPGEKWELIIPAGLANASGGAKSPKLYVVSYGNILPMQVAGVEAEPMLDAARELHIFFTKEAEELKPEDWARFISVEPTPADMTIGKSGRRVTMKGKFEHGAEYLVNVQAGLPARDGTALDGALQHKVKFAAHEPNLSLPSFAAPQWLAGKGKFEFSTANMAQVNVEVKRIPADRAVDAMRGYAVYQFDPSKENNTENTRIPFAAVSGKTVFSKTFPTAVELDHSERFAFTWDEVNGGQRKPGIYFVSVEASPKQEVKGGKKTGAQSLVQLTDIGLAWKFSGKEALIFAFSHTSGQPMADVTLRTYTDEGDAVGKITTGPDGTARLDMNKCDWLIASKGHDTHGMAFNDKMPDLDMWSFDVPFTGSPPDRTWKEMITFTDRPVYLPGETVFFKAIQRLQSASGLSLPPPGEAAKLELYDPQSRPILEREVTFSESGTLADTIRLPAQGLGWYKIAISGPLPKSEKKASDAGGEEHDTRKILFEQQILVQEYEPNAFRITFDSAAAQRMGDDFPVPLKAAYLMGKPLSEAEVSWTSRLRQAAFAPEKWEGFRFCHSRSYYVWDGQEYHSMNEETWMSPLLTGQGKLKLSDKGEALIEAKAPADFGVPGPKQITVNAEITDINQQTISSDWSHTEHTSKFYLGVKRGPNAVRVGETQAMELAAVQPNGERMEQPVKVSVLVEHLAWNAVRVETAGGGTSVRNDLVFAKVSEETVSLSTTGGVFNFKPATTGTHNLTFSSKDANGAPVLTVVSVDVFGADDMTWQQQDGVKMELVPDKDSYAPGDTAKVVVKTTLSGTALVTVEQNKVLWQKLQLLKPGGVVEIPVQEDWSPNVFVSVTHVRGGADDPREHKSPEYRVGFCPIRIESRRHQLALSIEPSKPEFRPGEMVDVTLSAKDSRGGLLPNTEIAFWAVDEGILSLMPWEAPNAYETFHYDRSLLVHTGISLASIMKENAKELEFSNKGFVIGGGGLGESPQLPLRRNFKPTAYWHGSLKTGADGNVKVRFPAPDNLTEFRLVAVGNEGVSRFGTAESKIKVNKPLMLEPALPRFANAGDVITLKAVVHNTTNKAADVKITLNLDDLCVLMEGGKPVESKTLTQTVSLAAQGTRAALFTVKFATDGLTVMNWKADGGSHELADAVETKLGIGIAESLLREVKFMALTGPDSGRNLLEKVRAEVLEGKGDVNVTISNSRVLEGAEAVEQLLQYPYGCAEQTMSSMLPWLAMRELKKVLPSINKSDEEITSVIQKGVDRLLSMQTNDGGLGYWPGAETASNWASAHGAVGLVMASRAGAAVPEFRLQHLLTRLSGSLRESGEESDSLALTDRAYAAWALALAGKAEAAYHETLFKKADLMPPSGRAMLALAIAESGGAADMAHALLGMKNDQPDWWLGSESTGAIRALALLKLQDPAAEEEMGRLMASRSPRGDWRNTFNNAWALLAISREAAASPPLKAGQAAVLTMVGQPQEIALPGELSSKSVTFPRDAGTTLPQLTAKVPDDAKLFAMVEVTGRGKSGDQPARNAGFSINRKWQRVATDGSLAPADALSTGDLVLVTLTIDVPASAEYLVIDDPLPATMEGVNPNFTSMAAADRQAAAPSWFCDHTEMRRDRMLFFRDSFEGKGRFAVQYLARVLAAGDVMAPPARIEMMYDPSRFGLSPSQRVQTRGSADDSVAIK